MKSMEQMQTEMLSKAKWDGGYPRAVCLFPGIVALAFNEEEWNAYHRENEICIYVVIGFFILCMVGNIIAAFWLGWW